MNNTYNMHTWEMSRIIDILHTERKRLKNCIEESKEHNHKYGIGEVDTYIDEDTVKNWKNDIDAIEKFIGGNFYNEYFNKITEAQES